MSQVHAAMRGDGEGEWRCAGDCRRQQVGQSAVRVRAAIFLQGSAGSSVPERGLAWR